MKLLTLLLALTTGETDRITLPAWQCRAVQAEIEHAWSVGGHTARDDGATVIEVQCVVPAFRDLITLSSLDICEME